MSSCVCRRVGVKNLMSKTLVINYTKCSDEQVITNYGIPPGQTREIWYIVGSFSTASPPSSYELVDLTLWPEGCETPTPEVETFFILYENSNIMTIENNFSLEYQY